MIRTINSNSVVSQSNCILLLGAGASKPLKLPLMSDFWPIVYKAPFRDDARKALDKLREVYLIRNGHDEFPDLENILDLIETYHSYYQIMFDDPIFKWDLYDKTMEKYWLFPSQEPKRKDYIQEHIKADIELSSGISLARNALYRIIFEKFAPTLDLQEVCNLYNPLFKTLFQKFNQNYIPVFTTNYDLVLETYAEDGHYPMETGFERVGGRLIWSPHVFHKFRPKQDVQTILLFKLHGSVSWKNEDGKVINYGLSLTGGPGNSVLIYPTQTKEYPYEEPFKTAYTHLSECLRNTHFLIAIGYGFRDRGMNSIIEEAVNFNKDLYIVNICGVSDTYSESNTAKLFPRERISTIRKNFEINLAADYLNELISLLTYRGLPTK